MKPMAWFLMILLWSSFVFFLVCLGDFIERYDLDHHLQRENDMSECLKVRPGFECRAIMERRGLFR